MEFLILFYDSNSILDELPSFFNSSILFFPNIIDINVLLSIPISLQNFFITFSNFIIFLIYSSYVLLLNYVGSILSNSLFTVFYADSMFRGDNCTFKFFILLMIGWNLLFSMPNKGFNTSKDSSVAWFSGYKLLRMGGYYGGLGGGMVLLVAEQDVVEQGTVTGQESTSYFQRFCMPILRLLGFLNNVEVGYFSKFFLELDDESDLSGDTEICNSHETHL
jgi:hypothetical protein